MENTSCAQILVSDSWESPLGIKIQVFGFSSKHLLHAYIFCSFSLSRYREEMLISCLTEFLAQV